MKTKVISVVLLSVALIWLTPTGTSGINNLEPKASHTKAAGQSESKLTATSVAQAEQPKVTQAEVQPETPGIPAQTVNVSTPVEPNTPEAWMQAVGLSDTDKQAAMYIIGQESGWCPTKWQGQYGACPAYHGVPQGEVGYGLCQATPASKMASAGDDWATNPITQLKWCNEYVQAYGGWEKAANFKRCTGLCFSPRILATVNKRTPWF